MNPRTEPLLWTQLLGLAVLPLEALLILLLLAGSHPGPVPLVEEVLCWSLGALAPALLLWRAPADVWSLLLAQIPARGRTDLQQRLSRLQDSLPLKLLGPGAGSLTLLPLLIRLDQQAAIAAPLWHPGHLPRLVALLLAALLLSLLLWHWQQLLQALWLLGRSESLIASTPPLSPEELKDTRLSLGLPLLLPSPLRFEAQAPRPTTSAPVRAPSPREATAANVISQREAGSSSEAVGPTAPGEAAGSSDGNKPSTFDGPALPVEPEQATADDQGPQLDEPIG